MDVILNYKSYYEEFKLGVVDSDYTVVAKLLIFPLFDPHTLLNDEGVPFEADPTNLSHWAHGCIPIHINIRTEASTDVALQKYIEYFRDT